MAIQVQPLHDRILVKRIKPNQEKTKGGIYLPENVQDSPQEIGIVEAVGPGKYTEKGFYVVPLVEPGDKVLFNGFAPSKNDIDVLIGMEDYVLIRDSDILAIIVGEPDTQELPQVISEIHE
jgi:chaperonin GroES